LGGNGIEASTNCCQLSAVSYQLSVTDLHFLYQRRQHLLDLYHLRRKALVCWIVQEFQIVSEHKLVFKFAGRPHRNLQNRMSTSGFTES
jgi:hypothetical protein